MKRKIGFLGAGNMGSAIMKGVAFSELRWDIEIYAFDPDESKVDALSGFDVIKCNDAAEVVKECDIVFLAVKPQSLENTLKSVKDYVKERMVFVSIVAGISSDYIRNSLEDYSVRVILAMPNTPLLLGEGATAIAESNSASEKQFDFVCRVFEACGKIKVIPENKMKEIIAVNGSSPAFIYLFAKGFIDNAVKNGIDEGAAKALFCQSLIGSSKMIMESEYDIDELIKMVSSPGGTTLAGLQKLYDNNLLKAVDEACDACTKRAYELAD